MSVLSNCADRAMKWYIALFAAFSLSATAATFTDDLKNGIDSSWQILNYDATAIQYASTGVKVKATNTGIYTTPNNPCPNILVQPIDPTDEIEISVTADITTANWGEQGGIFFYHDDDNYVKLVIERLYPNSTGFLVMLHEEGGVVDHYHSQDTDNKHVLNADGSINTSAPTSDVPGNDEIKVEISENQSDVHFIMDLRLRLSNGTVSMAWKYPQYSTWHEVAETMQLPSLSGQWYAGILTMYSPNTNRWQQYYDFTMITDDPPVSQDTYEAEDFTAKASSTTRTGSWASGGYFQDMYQSATAYVEWNNVSRTTAGSYDLDFTYANGDAYNRSCSVIVNGSTVGTLDFAPTGGWSTPATTSITVTLNSGNNTVRLQAANANGGPDFDKMEISTPTPTGGLAGHWKLDETSGAVATDDTVNANDGTVFSGTWTTGITGGALQTNGTSSYVDVTSTYGLPSGTQPITLAVWARSPVVQSGYKQIVAYGTDSSMQSIYLGRNGSSFVAGAYGDNVVTVSGVWDGDDEWHHVAMTFSGSTAVVYLDGSAVSTTSESWSIVPDMLRIGRQVNVYSEFWQGAIDDVRIYDYVLSASEIADLANPSSVVLASTYEAEYYSSVKDSSYRTGAWASNGHFQDMYQATDSFVEWDYVSTGSAGDATLQFTYANGSTYNRPCSIIVNGSTVATMDFPPTGSWSTPGTQSVTASLNAGYNTVRLQSASAATGVDLDKLDVLDDTAIYQAEDYTSAADSVFRYGGSWWTGSGFQDMFRASDSYVEWDNVASSGGSVTLTFAYTNGDTYDRICDVIVNGTTVGSVDFSPTGGWSTVGTETLSVTLNSGANTIRLQSASSEGGPDFDKMDISAN